MFTVFFNKILCCYLDAFEALLQHLISLRHSRVRSIRVAVAFFLTKMRLGLSNKVLALIFQLEDKRSVSRIIYSVRKAMVTDFVPKYLGFHHISRQTVIDHHTTAIARELLLNTPNQLAIVIDSTYIYVQKSSNNEFQRRSYSLHKHPNLIKVSSELKFVLSNALNHELFCS